ncbi:hypothetical protein [Streptomyces sp. FIT100]|uniref:hypothetical protein n=1 Tax=Streptomyces sp. FIT100 TaxID=2837956 RepID=UPI0021C607FF|nr:hypothetical protein [Streptomyces sp. FIT100]UUN26662.1 hypothetical protein KK483_09740 [Streptomyces sp. FIT100]
MRARTLVTGVAVTVLMGLGTTASGATTRGDSLGDSGGYELGFEHAGPGEGYWFTCPLLRNVSSVPITVIGVELLRAPDHWRTGEVGAVRQSDAHGPSLGARDESFTEDPNLLGELSEAPVPIAPGEHTPVYYLVRAEATTSPVSGRAEGCRFTYRTEHRIYVQDLRADFVLGPSGEG